MKKSVLLLAVLFIGLAGYSCDIVCSEPEGLTSSASRFFSTVTGQKALAEKIGAAIIKKSIKQNITSGKIKTDVKAFSTKDLKAGKFKSIELLGQDINIQDVYITKFHAKTLCEYNYIEPKSNGDVFIKDDIPFAIEIELTENDLNRTMQSEHYQRIMNDINNLGGGYKIFHINSTSVKIKDGKFYYIAEYTLPFVKQPKNLVIVSDLYVKDGVIKFDNSKIFGNSMSLDVDKISGLINYINPLDFSLKMEENRNTKINIKNVKIEEGKIIADGILTVLKDKE